MLSLTDTQRDVITEVVNLGLGRAAGSLSRLTGHRVFLEVPRIDILPLDGVEERLGALASEGDVCGVVQAFGGRVDGQAVLFLPLPSARNLLELLVGRPLTPARFTELEQSALMEVGNVVINACLASLGSLLETRFTFLVPHVVVQEVGPLLRGERPAGDPVCLLIESRFRVREKAVDGYLAVVVGAESAGALAAAADRAVRSSGGAKGLAP